VPLGQPVIQRRRQQKRLALVIDLNFFAAPADTLTAASDSATSNNRSSPSSTIHQVFHAPPAYKGILTHGPSTPPSATSPQSSGSSNTVNPSQPGRVTNVTGQRGEAQSITGGDLLIDDRVPGAVSFRAASLRTEVLEDCIA